MLKQVLPIDICTGILTLPIAPAMLGQTDGTRGTYNDQRTFITPLLRTQFPTCAVLADALQRPSVARLLAETLEIEVEGGYLRVEYIQDLDGAWLEPHRDVPEKMFSMVIYLFTGPHAKDWAPTSTTPMSSGSAARRAISTRLRSLSPTGTWHGLELRPIIGVAAGARLMEINYVRPSWRERGHLLSRYRPVNLRC